MLAAPAIPLYALISKWLRHFGQCSVWFRAKDGGGTDGVDPYLTVAANSSGGVCGKMISPQSISVATAASGLVGKDGDLFRFTLWHSIAMVLVMSVITFLQAYWFKWMLP